MLEGLTPPKNKSVFCKVDDLAVEMTPEDREIFMSAINDREVWSANSLSTALRQRGVSIADTTIAKHRNQACACFRG
jgi:hypothetical protein